MTVTAAKDSKEKDVREPAPKKAKDKKVCRLFADADPPVYAEDIGSIRFYRWEKGKKGKTKATVPDEDYWIDGDEDEMFEFDFEETDERALERQFGCGDYYIDALWEHTGRTMDGGRSFSLGGVERRRGLPVKTDDDDSNSGDDPSDSNDDDGSTTQVAVAPAESESTKRIADALAQQSAANSEMMREQMKQAKEGPK